MRLMINKLNNVIYMKFVLTKPVGLATKPWWKQEPFIVCLQKENIKYFNCHFLHCHYFKPTKDKPCQAK